MFDDDSNLKDNGQKKPPGNGFNRLPVFTLLAWAGIIAAVAVLFLVKEKNSVNATPLSQAEFLDKFASNQLATANILVNPQTLPLAEVNGSYYTAPDKEG